MKRLYAIILIFSFFTTTAYCAVSAAKVSVLGYKMYPNPLSGDMLQITHSLDIKQGVSYIFTISNIIGQAVYTHTLTDEEVKKGNFTINLENIKLDKGFYLTKLSNGSNNAIQKLVVR